MAVKDERKSETTGGRKARRKAIFLCFTREQPDRVPRWPGTLAHSAVRFFVLKDVSRYTFVSRNTSIYKGVQFLRLGTTTWTNEAIDGYILGIYLCTCAYVMADRTRWIRMYRFALLRYAHSRREVRRILLDESKRESRTRRARAYYCLRYAFHRCWTRAFSLDTTTTTEKYVRTGIGVCWEGYAFSLSVKLPVVCFGNIFRFYLGSLLFKEIEKKGTEFTLGRRSRVKGGERSRSRFSTALQPMVNLTIKNERKKDNGNSLRARQYSVSRLRGHATPLEPRRQRGVG